MSCVDHGLVRTAIGCVFATLVVNAPCYADQLQTSSRATQLLTEATELESLLPRARNGERQAEQALRQAQQALQLAREYQDAQAEAIAREAVAIAESSLAEARAKIAGYEKRRGRLPPDLAKRLEGVSAADVADIKGDVFVITSLGPARIGPGFKLQAGDTVKTGENGRAGLEFRDGSRVELREHTEFQATTLEGDETLLNLNLGTLRATVIKLAQRRFAVRTPTSAIAVRGTEFETTFEKGVTTISVTKGEVEVSPAQGGDRVTVPGGSWVEVSPQGAISKPLPITTRRPSV